MATDARDKLIVLHASERTNGNNDNLAFVYEECWPEPETADFSVEDKTTETKLSVTIHGHMLPNYNDGAQGRAYDLSTPNFSSPYVNQFKNDVASAVVGIIPF